MFYVAINSYILSQKCDNGDIAEITGDSGVRSPFWNGADCNSLANAMNLVQCNFMPYFTRLLLLSLTMDSSYYHFNLSTLALILTENGGLRVFSAFEVSLSNVSKGNKQLNTADPYRSALFCIILQEHGPMCAWNTAFRSDS